MPVRREAVGLEVPECLNNPCPATVKTSVRRIIVHVPWPAGLHLRPAAKLVKAARSFRSSITVKCGERVGDIRSILSIVALCATLGTAINFEVAGEDEEAASLTIEQVFLSTDT